MKKAVLLIIAIVSLLLIALTQSHDCQYMKDLKEFTYIEYKPNNIIRNPMTGEIVTTIEDKEAVDHYYRTYLNESIPVFVNIYDGEIILLTEVQGNATDHGAVYDIEFNKVHDIEPDIEFIVHALRWTEKRMQSI